MVQQDRTSRSDSARAGAFSEAAIWERVGRGWRQLQGSFRDLGFSLEWHDFSAEKEFDWSPSFHPGGVEICLNLSGRGEVQAGSRRLELAPETAGFYLQTEAQLTGRRAGGERHRFLTVELSAKFIAQHIEPKENGLSPLLRDFLSGQCPMAVSSQISLSLEHQQLVAGLSRPPVAASAQRMWFHAKALEIASAFLYKPDSGSELFCHRHNRKNHERVQKVISLLRENLVEPPSLEEIGRRVGCSQFYLSRIFTQEIGRSIFQYLRGLRMERAAQLLREKKMNVTQVALEVGYTSPSHFSAAFHETHGCCPGLFPLDTLGAGPAGSTT